MRGPKPDILKFEGDWRKLMKQSLQKTKPKDGWPSSVLTIGWPADNLQ
jgi:hypothetical protein